MSTEAKPVCQLPILNLFVDRPETTDDKVILFCNGIFNTENDARKSAQLISENFGNRQVVICYNPTWVSFFFCQSTKKLFPEIVTDEVVALQEAQEQALAFQLMREINRLIIQKKHVYLFAHSHGAYLSKLALQKLNELQKSKRVLVRANIDVYTFGGITIIPNTLTKDAPINLRVMNCLFNWDGWAHPFGACLRDGTKEHVQTAREAWWAKRELFRDNSTAISRSDIDTYCALDSQYFHDEAEKGTITACNIFFQNGIEADFTVLRNAACNGYYAGLFLEQCGALARNQQKQTEAQSSPWFYRPPQPSILDSCYFAIAQLAQIVGPVLTHQGELNPYKQLIYAFVENHTFESYKIFFKNYPGAL